MTGPLKRAILPAILALVVGPPASAHHSAAMYDRSKPVTVKAVVKALNWTNPHCSLVVVGDPTQGAAPDTLTVEMSSPAVLTRAGWSKRTFNPGEHIELVYAPLRRGGPSGQFISAVNAAGKVIKWDFSPGESAITP